MKGDKKCWSGGTIPKVHFCYCFLLLIRWLLLLDLCFTWRWVGAITLHITQIRILAFGVRILLVSRCSWLMVNDKYTTLPLQSLHKSKEILILLTKWCKFSEEKDGSWSGKHKSNGCVDMYLKHCNYVLEFFFSFGGGIKSAFSQLSRFLLSHRFLVRTVAPGWLHRYTVEWCRN